MDQAYKKQVALLLNVLPEVAKEKCFALHGGTAINLFVRDMPRLSVDIDLTYVPIEDRNTSIQNINDALRRIKANIEHVIPNVVVTHNAEAGKLLVAVRGAQIKLEVNLTNRGTIAEPTDKPLCDKAQSEFDVFVSMPVVPIGQLFGGKIVAALDRQHPRDLFDVKYLLQNEGFSDEVRKGFLLLVLCNERPINEVIRPNFQNQQSAHANQFLGMTNEAFSYEEFEAVRTTLVETVHCSLTDNDKAFLLSVKNVTPDWALYDFERFPALAWKLKNLQALKEKNPAKHQEQYEKLKSKLNK